MKDEHFHFIGIGGIGMSGCARFLLAQNRRVSGSDCFMSPLVKELASEGAVVYDKHLASNISDQMSTVIYSTAIDASNPEIEKAKKLGCALWHRSDLLAYLMQSQEAIAIAGTHGKTTTSALLSHVLVSAKRSPSFILGGLMAGRGINAQLGENSTMVVEADESDGSFLKYHPEGAVITNIELDHLNYYRDLNHVQETFLAFVKQVKNKDLLVWCADCPQLKVMNPPGWSYGFDDQSNLVISKARQGKENCVFDLHFKGRSYADVELAMIGRHNILNAAAVWGMALQLGVTEEDIRRAFLTFQGVKRRAQKIGEASKVMLYDDYAHHPTEIQCVLQGFANAFEKRRRIALFQPHRASRLIPLQEEFAAAFSQASEVWLTDVYVANESTTELFSLEEYAKRIAEASQVHTVYVKNEELLDYFKAHIKPFDVLVTLGAGDITHFGPQALKALEETPVHLKVGILSGFQSYEHHISLISAKFYQQACLQDHIKAHDFFQDPDGNWSYSIEDILACDVLIPALHGRQGEDGMIQGFLTALKKPFTGPSYEVSSLNMNKIWMKHFVKGLGVEVADGLFFNQSQWQEDSIKWLDNAQAKLTYPMVIKPASLGSTIGVAFAKDRASLKAAIDQAFELDKEVIIEERIQARELEIACLETEDGVVVTHPGEVKSESRAYDYVAKYSQNPIEKVVQADLSPEVTEKSRALALQIYEAMQLKSYARIDFFLTHNQRLIFAEVNTLPGTTPRSLFQRTLQASGLCSEEIVNQMLIQGMHRHRKELRKSIQIKKFLKTIENVTPQ